MKCETNETHTLDNVYHVQPSNGGSGMQPSFSIGDKQKALLAPSPRCIGVKVAGMLEFFAIRLLSFSDAVSLVR